MDWAKTSARQDENIFVLIFKYLNCTTNKTHLQYERYFIASSFHTDGSFSKVIADSLALPVTNAISSVLSSNEIETIWRIP